MENIKTLFISDVHLGTKKCQADKLLEVFKRYDFEKRDSVIIENEITEIFQLRESFGGKIQ